MASRGRGRGGRGGRGFGRGVTSISGALARDDDGAALALDKGTGPPPLFPKIDALPDLPEITSRDEQLLVRRRRLASAWRYSPYFLKAEKNEEQDAKSVAATPLATVMKLSLANFPGQLLGPESLSRSKNKKSSRAAASAWVTPSSLSAAQDLQRLDQLASLEMKKEKGGGEDEEKKGEGEEDDEEEGEEEEEEQIGEDDYAENFGFDDDDEYLDDDDGGADEGPVF